MAGLTGSVGENGKNARPDVALVQFMLAVARDANGRAYYGTPYSGHYDAGTKLAIAALLGAKPQAVIAPDSSAWSKLLAAVPDRYKTARVMPGSGVTVYQPADRHFAETSANSIKTNANLNDEFKGKIARLVTEFYNQYQIALTVQGRTGGRRTFQEQVHLNSDSAPGESIHHYGHAVDIGFSGLRWINGKGDISTTDDWLRELPSQPQRLAFWEARNKIADRLKLYSTIKKGGGDFIHLQNYDDNLLDSVTSFMTLLELVGPRKMKWKPVNMTPTDYWCDLGLGGDKYFVGTGLDIWKSTPRLTKSDLAAAVNAKLKKEPNFSLDGYLGLGTPPKNAPDAGTTPLRDTDITPAHLGSIQRLLRAEFDAADKDWRLWKPVFYQGSARRPSHQK
jgi:hypothetical protein